MPPKVREIRRNPSFDKNLDKLERKQRGLTASVREYLEQCAARQPDRRYKLQGMNDRPVFKERLALPGIGKRRGARIIVYCDDDVVIPLSIYAKSERGIVPEGIINDELVAVGIAEPNQDTPAE